MFVTMHEMPPPQKKEKLAMLLLVIPHENCCQLAFSENSGGGLLDPLASHSPRRPPMAQGGGALPMPPEIIKIKINGVGGDRVYRRGGICILCFSYCK